MKYYRILINCSDGKRRYVGTKGSLIMAMPMIEWSSAFSEESLNDPIIQDLFSQRLCQVEEIMNCEIYGSTFGRPSSIHDGTHLYTIYRPDLMRSEIRISKLHL